MALCSQLQLPKDVLISPFFMHAQMGAGSSWERDKVDKDRHPCGTGRRWASARCPKNQHHLPGGSPSPAVACDLWEGPSSFPFFRTKVLLEN